MRAHDSATAHGAIAAPATAAPPASGTEAAPATPEALPARNAAPAGTTTATDPDARTAHTERASPTERPASTTPAARPGVLLAVLGVAFFSLTFPATAWALEGFGPWSATALRVLLAGLVAGGALAVLRRPLPARRHWVGLAIAASGVVIGFPLLTTLALQTSTTAHAAVVVGLLPLTTAVYSTLRGGSRPSRLFWVAALAGAAVVVAFALQQSGGTPTRGDLYLCGALLLCAAAYAEGGRLAREMPALDVIGWALVACLPLAAVGSVIALLHESVQLTAHSVTGLLWNAVGSQFLGLLFWYRAMGLAGVARTSQVQLSQPLLTLVWSVLLLGEHLSPAAPAAAVAVLVCIAVVQRTRA
ncbi:DMT family transporter [Streptomyces iconiensis]|uniref:DMT family transporter n=1 Tax=Streptomyces iconiensis TaxID=1384038 RepID=A0ABT6ZUZ8_9ACTN|nr:DMT family transporter [Streptomyces iconiensis]MDJ1132268.1 DMT family transporter [Streptomyces iconiensis]